MSILERLMIATLSARLALLIIWALAVIAAIITIVIKDKMK